MPHVPFGTGTVSFRVPGSLAIEEPVPPEIPEEPLEQAIEKALRIPMGKPPIRIAAKGAKNAVIVVPDATRPLPTARILVPLVDQLEEAGLAPADITVVVALGMHRNTTQEEKDAILGEVKDRGVAIVDHDPAGPLKDFGKSFSGAPLLINETVAESDFCISLGSLEPHQYAGFSGGWKTVGIGCAGEATIAHTHSPKVLADRNCHPGNVDRNPFLDVVREAGRKAHVKFALNVIAGRGGGLVAATAGDPGVVFRILVPRAQKAFALPVREPACVVVAGVGSPKDVNLYQASRAATNLVFGPVDAVKENGTIIIPAPCPEGVGQGTGEQRFAEALRGDRAALAARDDGDFLPGEQRAWVLAQVLQNHKVVIAGSSLDAADLESMGLGSAATVDDALAAAAADGATRVMIVQQAIGCLPQKARR
ncbi:MAG: lactate racemase domain-containing protein [Planctomycetota bacterium]